MPRREIYQANREKCLKLKKAWDDRNREKISASMKRYYHKNKAMLKAKSNRYHHSHKVAANERTRQWHKSNPAQSKANKSNAKHTRRAKEYATRVNPYGIYQWMKRVKSTPVVTCHWCGESMLGILAVFDHVIAISKGGAHTLENLCVSCGSCNSSKKDKLPHQWSVYGQSFLSL